MNSRNKITYFISLISIIYLATLFIWNRDFRPPSPPQNVSAILPDERKAIITPNKETSITFFVLGDWGADTGERKLVAEQFRVRYFSQFLTFRNS